MSKNHSEIAVAYAEDIVSSRIPACSYVIMAAQRFLDDLKRQGSEDFPYAYNADVANRACRFMELLPHVKGKWAAQRKLLELEPWQCFIECNIFGWLHTETGLRRFREAYEEVPRKNGKSIRLSARGIYLFAADNESGAEVYSGATTEKQAYEIFRPAWIMVQRLQNLRERFSIDLSGTAKNPGAMHIMSDMSRFETMIGKPGDGSSPHAALIDEYHEHDSDHMVDAMQTGMGAREQPLLSIITTAGSNLAGPCFEKRREVIQILEKRSKAENVFGIIYTTDENDDWNDPNSLIKANPNYGVSVFPEFLQSQLEQAKRSAAKQNSFRTKHLNQWVGARTVWMNMLAWRRQQKADFDPDKLREYPCWIAVDLASKRDVAAIVILWQKDDKYYSHHKFYAPESAVEENEKYLAFANGGDMVLTPGNMTDYAFIEEEIVKLWKEYDVQDVAFDDWQANYLITRLQQQNIEVINYNQTVKNMSEPMKEVEALVVDGRLFHDGNKCMNWMMGNVTARIDAKDNIYPRKENEKDKNCKIDGPVALIMAMGRAKQGGGINQSDYTIAFV